MTFLLPLSCTKSRFSMYCGGVSLRYVWFIWGWAATDLSEFWLGLGHVGGGTVVVVRKGLGLWLIVLWPCDSVRGCWVEAWGAWWVVLIYGRSCEASAGSFACCFDLGGPPVTWSENRSEV